MRILPTVLDTFENIAIIDEIILELVEAQGGGEEGGEEERRGETAPSGGSPLSPAVRLDGSPAGVRVCVLQAIL